MRRSMITVHVLLARHLPWSGMEWHGSPGSFAQAIRATLEICRAEGWRMALDIELQGLDRLAADDPQCLESLAQAVRTGTIEITASGYAQPISLFHGGESNVRQRVEGARALERLLGARPRTAWSQTFDFFPQLPQLLALTGHEGALLCFPWERSTPTIVHDGAACLLWEGLDGTRLRTLIVDPLPASERSADRLLERWRSMGARSATIEAQWIDGANAEPSSPSSFAEALELKTALAQNTEYEWRSSTPTDALRALPPARFLARALPMDHVYHGTSLGKNGDYMPRYSRMCEEQLLAAESVAALAALLGHPYATPRAHPGWELGESWRELLAAQHYRVHEREAQSGPIGERSFERSLALSSEVFLRTLEHVGRRVDATEGSTIVFNTLGWTRDVPHHGGVVRDVPAWGYKVVDPYESDAVVESRLGPIRMTTQDDVCTLSRGRFKVEIDRQLGLVRQITSREFPQGLLAPGQSLGALRMKRDGKWERFSTVHFSGDASEDQEYAEFQFVREGRGGSKLRVTYGLSPLHDALWLRLQADALARPDPGSQGALSSEFQVGFEPLVLLHDHPYGVSTIAPMFDFVRHYPGPADRGETPGLERLWQETQSKPFTALSMVDLCEGSDRGRGLLLVHDGSQSMQREEHGVRTLFSLFDPWDDDVYDGVLEAEMWLVPHGSWTHTDRMKVAMECNLGSPRFEDYVAARGGGNMPSVFGALAVDAPNVLPTAFYRDAARGVRSDKHFARAGDALSEPFVLRLVEFDGRPADVVVRVPGPVRRAARTNLLGEVVSAIEPTSARAPFGPKPLPWSALRLQMGPHEIATVYMDLELGHSASAGEEVRRAKKSARRRGT